MQIGRDVKSALLAGGITTLCLFLGIGAAVRIQGSDRVKLFDVFAISSAVGILSGSIVWVFCSKSGSGPIASLPPSEPVSEGRQPIDQAMEMLGSYPASKVAVYNAAVGRGEETSRLYQNALALDQALRESQHLFPEPKPEPSPVTAWEVQGSPVTEHVIHPGHDWEPDPDPLPEELFSGEPIGNEDPWEEVTPRTQIQAPGPNIGW